MYTTNCLTGDAYTYQAPTGAFITHTTQGPVVAFPMSASPGWGIALMNVGYLNPGPALPTPAVVGPTTPTVNPASTLPSDVLTVSSLPLLIDTTPTTTTAVTGSITDPTPSKLAAGLDVLAFVPRSPGMETYHAKLALPVPVAAMSTAHLPTLTTPATVQPRGSVTTVTTAVPASTETTAAAVGALPATQAVVTAPPISTSTVESSSSCIGVAVTGSSVSGLNPPGSTYVPPT